MSFNNVVTVSVREGANTLTDTRTITTEAEYKIIETVADATTDGEVAISIDVSQLKAFGMISTQDLTVKTNSSGAPQETFNLTAGEMVFFREGDAAIFAGDVTAFFVTNSSGAAATFSVIAGIDPTI